MKLRIRDNTLRIRLTQGEVSALAAGESVEQTTWFSSSQKLGTVVIPLPEQEFVRAVLSDDEVRVMLPARLVRDWAMGDQVGIEGEQPIVGRPSLRILIEKDFQCLHGTAEGISDAYPNPRDAAKRIQE